MADRLKRPIGVEAADHPVVIIGGGMAGSLLALVLGRAGCRVCIVDLQQEPAPEFRNEKLGIDQIERLDALGVLPCFQQACWGDGAAVTGQRTAVDKPDLKDCGARYDRWIGCIRAAWPAEVEFVLGKVDRIDPSDDLQTVRLSDGRTLTARLAVLATGRGERLRSGLGMSRRIISEKHSICIGFSLLPSSGRPNDVQARIVEGRIGDRIAYMTIFPMLDEVRVNVFSYHAHDDVWVAAMKQAPLATLSRSTPEVGAVLQDAQIVRKPEVRSTDLYAIDGHLQAGVVLLGDAYHAPCPASGTGMTRILNDIDRLAHRHLPAWFATPGMDGDKITAFYGDPVKAKVDRASLRRSMNGKASTVSRSPYWRARRSLGIVKRALQARRGGMARAGEGAGAAA